MSLLWWDMGDCCIPPLHKGFFFSYSAVQSLVFQSSFLLKEENCWIMHWLFRASQSRLVSTGGKRGGFKNQTTNEKNWFLSRYMQLPTSKLKWGDSMGFFLSILFPRGWGGAAPCFPPLSPFTVTQLNICSTFPHCSHLLTAVMCFYTSEQTFSLCDAQLRF